MLVNYIKLKNISNRGKVLAVSIIGGIFIVLVLMAVWHRNFSDTLVRYVPTKSDFYIHFSRPKINDSTNIDKIIYQILDDFGLSDYKSLDLSREMSVVGQLIDGQMHYGVILTTDRPAKARQALENAGLTYKFVSSHRIVIASDNLLSFYIKDRQNSVAQKVSRRFSAFNSLSIYANSNLVSAYDNDLLLGLLYKSAIDETGDMFLGFVSKRDGLRMSIRNSIKSSRDLDYFVSETPVESIDGDLVIATSNFSDILSGWLNDLDRASRDDSQIFMDTVLSKYLDVNSTTIENIDKLFLVAKYNDNNSGWLFGDYGFVFELDGINTEIIEETFKTVMAYQYPTFSNVYLSDGTRVKELRPNTDDFEFVERNGVKTLYSPDKEFKFMYLINDGVIRVSNDDGLMSGSYPDILTNYLFLKTGVIDTDGIGQYINMFNSVEVGSKGILLK
jgi:hypothetical protein